MTSEEIKKAMHEFSPVVYNGIEYERITAYIYRIIKTHGAGLYKTILQVELQDKNTNSITIADAKKVELLKGAEK